MPSTTTAAPQYNLQQQQQAFSNAYQKLWARAPTSAEMASMITSVSPNNMEGYVRSSLRNAPGDVLRIVASVFPSAIGRPATGYEATGVISTFGNYWSDADSLSTYFRGVTSFYRTPNYGPQAAPQIPSAALTRLGTPGSKVFMVNNTVLRPAILDAGGYLISQGGGNLTAMASVGSFGLYNSASITNLLQISAANLMRRQRQLAMPTVAGIGNLAANVTNTNGSNIYGVQPVGGFDPASGPPLAPAATGPVIVGYDPQGQPIFNSSQPAVQPIPVIPQQQIPQENIFWLSWKCNNKPVRCSQRKRFSSPELSKFMRPNK